MNQQIYLIEIDAYNPATSAVVTLRYGTNGYWTLPADTPSRVFFEPRIDVAGLPTIEQFIYANGRVAGGVSVGSGSIKLINADGGLDTLRTYGFDGRSFRIYRLPGVAAAWSTRELWFSGTIEQPEFTYTYVNLLVRDPLYNVNQPYQPALFAGTNSGPTGLEGTANDIKDQPKPRLYGKVFQVRPAPVNTSRLMYAVNYDRSGNRAPVASFDGVYDKGAAITYSGNNYATAALLDAASVTAGQYSTCIAEGLFRLGSTPQGTVTCDVSEGATTADRTAAQIVKRILISQGISTYDNASFTALDALNSSVVGVYTDTNAKTLEVCDQVLRSIGAFITVKRDGTFFVGRFDAPSGTPVATIDWATQVEDGPNGGITTLRPFDGGNGIPAFRCTVKYAKLWTTQAAGELAGVSAAQQAYLSNEYRSVKSEDNAVKTVYLTSPEIEFETLLTSEANATTEATRLLSIYSVYRDVWEVSVSTDIAGSLNMNDTVSFVVPGRFDLSSGKLFVIIGKEENANAEKTVLTLFG